MQSKQHRSDASTEAGTYAAGLEGQQAYNDRVAYGAGAPIYDDAHNVIANNASGGAGYFAEAHHTASLNIDAKYQGLDFSAERLGSTAFGSPDIVVAGVQFNPKFYQTAQDSYNAGAQLINDGGTITAKYADQIIVVPSDQLAQVQQLHSQAIAEAYASNDVQSAHALESIQYADRIDYGGAQSLPLSYADAQEGAEGIRDGVLPGYVGEDSTLLGNVGEGALLAVAVALATSIGPQLMSDVAETLRGRIKPAELTERLKENLTTAQIRTEAGWALSRGGAAAALSALDAIDPFGAALLANLLMDAVKLSQSVRNGEIEPGKFGGEFLEQAKSRMGYTTLTAGAYWVAGPLGLLVPIIVKRMVGDVESQRKILNAWKQTRTAFRADFESRIRGVALVEQIGQHYRNTEASNKASTRNLKAIEQDVANIAKLLSFRPGSLK
ncbi:hypothetical protein [Oryzisolibacter sp. LB2S]|uniref:hypothetical protein n=1 Tax=Alicycliphilus soli TaxID=3228789 RepID=UPI00345A4439